VHGTLMATAGWVPLLMGPRAWSASGKIPDATTPAGWLQLAARATKKTATSGSP
jgi:hypothetical protein